MNEYWWYYIAAADINIIDGLYCFCCRLHCKQCDFSCNHEAWLVTHMRQHAKGKTDHRCEFCGYTAPNPHRLKVTHYFNHQDLIRIFACLLSPDVGFWHIPWHQKQISVLLNLRFSLPYKLFWFVKYYHIKCWFCIQSLFLTVIKKTWMQSVMVVLS